jgi:hypothetical protein
LKSGIYNPPLVLSPVFYHIVRKKTRITERRAGKREGQGERRWREYREKALDLGRGL